MTTYLNLFTCLYSTIHYKLQDGMNHALVYHQTTRDWQKYLTHSRGLIKIFWWNTAAPQYIRQRLTVIKEETDSKTIIVGDFNTSLTPMDRSPRQKINKETQALSDTIGQIDLIDIYRTFDPKTAGYNFFSSAHGTFSRIDHILGHKSSLCKFKKTEIISSIFSDHNTKRLEIN